MATSDVKTVAEYRAELPEDRRRAIKAVRSEIRKRLPKWYEETMQYGMISYIVPSKVLAKTYNGQPLALASLGNQKNYMTVYLMNIYGSPTLESWFNEAYAASGKKLDMGKSCVRFKRLEDLPVELIGEAVSRTPVDEFVAMYQASREGLSKR